MENRKTITEASPSISKVFVVDGGRGGLKVNYNVAQTINGLMNNKKRAEVVERPVQKEIREGFKELKEHLLKGCGYYWPNDKVLDLLKGKIEVNCISVNKHDYIQVSGVVKIDHDKYASVSTPFLSDDYYEGTIDLNRIVDGIFEEAKLFMVGAKGADARQITIDYLTVKKQISDAEGSLNSMSKEAMDSLMDEALRDSGLRIVVEDGVEVIIPVEEEQKESVDFMASGAQAVSGQEEVSEEVPFVDVATQDDDESNYIQM